MAKEPSDALKRALAQDSMSSQNFKIGLASSLDPTSIGQHTFSSGNLQSGLGPPKPATTGGESTTPTTLVADAGAETSKPKT